MPREPRKPGNALLKVKDPKKAAVVVAIVCVTIAFAWLIGEPVKGEVETKLNWCNIASAGVSDQNRKPDDDRERATNWILDIDSYRSRWVFWNNWETDEQQEIRIALGGWVGCGNKPRSSEATSTTRQSATEIPTTRQPATGSPTTGQHATGTSTTGQYATAASCQEAIGGGNSFCHAHNHMSGPGIVDHGGGWHSHTDSDDNCVGHEHEGENHSEGRHC